MKSDKIFISIFFFYTVLHKSTYGWKCKGVKHRNEIEGLWIYNTRIGQGIHNIECLNIYLAPVRMESNNNKRSMHTEVFLKYNGTWESSKLRGIFNFKRKKFEFYWLPIEKNLKGVFLRLTICEKGKVLILTSPKFKTQYIFHKQDSSITSPLPNKYVHKAQENKLEIHKIPYIECKMMKEDEKSAPARKHKDPFYMEGDRCTPEGVLNEDYILGKFYLSVIVVDEEEKDIDCWDLNLYKDNSTIVGYSTIEVKTQFGIKHEEYFLRGNLKKNELQLHMKQKNGIDDKEAHTILEFCDNSGMMFGMADKPEYYVFRKEPYISRPLWRFFEFIERKYKLKASLVNFLSCEDAHKMRNRGKT